MEWTDEDQMLAKKDGWMIQKNLGRDGFEIVKNPASSVFMSDEDAKYHVITLAIEGGSALHNKALNIGKEIPKEWIEEAGELALKLEDWE